ncbi:hypothetical protein [Olleya sp. HaHaR_3_96]|uniref:hypothetical protein n=1 Tax=Olleya sp. HaHaR_3_96 TaxID=2745560 RepID=UPI001C4EB64F|nr:hypothetical protein [Olleya sp. HaHaR_3_96]QXP58672.1 hypothetical protein H0I26_12190 [Olleya sp. HaHaR_3_96]
MKIVSHSILLLVFCLCSCKTEKSKTPRATSEKVKSVKGVERVDGVEQKENYKVCFDESAFKDIRLGNYAHILKITPDISKPKNNMEYRILLIRDKKKADIGHLKLKDTITNILINKKSIKDLYKDEKRDSITIDNFHVMTTRYNYSRASEMHFEVVMYSIQDSVFCNAGYHFNYGNGNYRFSLYKKQQTKTKAFEEYNNFECY